MVCLYSGVSNLVPYQNQNGLIRTQLMDPSGANAFLYQQDLHYRQQLQPKGPHQTMPMLAGTATPNSLVPLGGQQRYVGGLNYAMQVPQPAFPAAVGQPVGVSLTPSRSYHPSQPARPASVFSKQPPVCSSSMLFGDSRPRVVTDMVLQPDSFRRLSGITSEVFRQIEAVEAQFDPSTLAAQYAEMERRGEMIIRILNPTAILSGWLEDTIRRYGDGVSLPGWVQFVEIIKRPGQTLGLYIREGDSVYTSEGVYISRIALESPVYQSGCLRVGDEILAVNMVDVQRMSLDDVVIVMSIPRRLILTIRSRPLNATEHMLAGGRQSIYDRPMGAESYYDTVPSDIYSRVDELRKPVVVLKQQLNSELDEDEEEEVLAAATAAAEAGFDDPSATAAAAVAGLNNPTPATAAAAVAAVNQLARARSGSIDLFDLGVKGRSLRPLGARPKMFASTADNLADLYQNAGFEEDLYMNVRRPFERPSSRLSGQSGLLQMNKASHLPPSSLYHGRLTSRSRSSTGRLLRTSSEQMLLAETLPLDFRPPGLAERRFSVGGPVGSSDQSTDYLLSRYNSLMQRRYQSLERAGAARTCLKNSFSSQSLVPAGSHYQRRLEALGIPLPAMAEMAARSRRGRYRDTGYSDTEASVYDLLPARRAITPSLSSYGPRSSSLPRTSLGPMYGRSGRASGSQRAHLESLYASPSKRHSTARTMPVRPHSAIGTYYSEHEDDTGTRSRRALGESASSTSRTKLPCLGPKLSQRQQPQLPFGRLDPFKAEAESLEKKLSRVPSTSAIYETIRKSKMAQDMSQPHSGSLVASEDFTPKQRFTSSSLQRFKSKDDYVSQAVDCCAPKFAFPQPTRHIGDLAKPADFDLASVAARPQIGPTVAPPTDRPSRPLMIDPSGFQQYGAEMRSSHRDEQTLAGFSGLLVIHLLGLRGLQLDGVTSQTGSATTQPDLQCNLYCVVECDRVYKARTVAVQSHDNNQCNFDWDEIFDIDLFDTKEVTFLFYTWNASSRHKLCSKGTIHLPWISTLRTQHVHAFEMRLYETPGAMLYIKLEFHDLASTFKRTKRDAKPAAKGLRTGSLQLHNEQPLFGLDLDTVVARENSGFPVPIIVKRCTEEIERRGLHLVGIYRLCGSAIRKRYLRDNFEKNSWLSDLSAESVPDINVIASEYLSPFNPDPFPHNPAQALTGHAPCRIGFDSNPPNRSLFHCFLSLVFSLSLCP